MSQSIIILLHIVNTNSPVNLAPNLMFLSAFETCFATLSNSPKNIKFGPFLQKLFLSSAQEYYSCGCDVCFRNVRRASLLAAADFTGHHSCFRDVLRVSLTLTFADFTRQVFRDVRRASPVSPAFPFCGIPVFATFTERHVTGVVLLRLCYLFLRRSSSVTYYLLQSSADMFFCPFS